MIDIKEDKEVWRIGFLIKSRIRSNSDKQKAGECKCKDLAKGTVSDRILKDRGYEIALNSKHD